MKEPTIREVVDAAMSHAAEDKTAAERRYRIRRRRFVGAYISAGFVIVLGFTLFDDLPSAFIASGMALLSAVGAVALSEDHA
jgi:hypothetical protein